MLDVVTCVTTWCLRLSGGLICLLHTRWLATSQFPGQGLKASLCESGDYIDVFPYSFGMAARNLWTEPQEIMTLEWEEQMFSCFEFDIVWFDLN